MFCNHCGAQNEDNAGFCASCGGHLEPAAPVPPKGYAPPPGYVPPQGYAPAGYPPIQAMPPVKKKRTGLIIGLICGGVALIGAAIAAYFLFFAGVDVNGTWVCEDRGWVLEMKDGQLNEYGPAGSDSAKYEYDKASGEGSADLSDGEVSFIVKKDRMVVLVQDTDETYSFERGDKDVDIEAVVLEAVMGLWSSEAQGEVLDFAEDGVLKIYSGPGDFEGTYEFDTDKGKGSLTANGQTYGFTVGWDGLEIPEIGSYIHAAKGIDIVAFVAEFAGDVTPQTTTTPTADNPLVGVWYDQTGEFGYIEFFDDWTFLYEEVTGTYTFDAATGTGSATDDANTETLPLSYADGVMTLDGVPFTMDYVDPGTDDNSALIGTWYETSGIDENFTFYSDYTIDIYSNGEYFYGTYTYDVMSEAGTITFDINGSDSYLDYTMSGGVLTVDSYTYTQDGSTVTTDDTSGNTILGTWYDTGGALGTLYFDKDGLVIMDVGSEMYYGTYTFDETVDSGSLTVDTYDGSYTLSLLLWDGFLYTDDGTYTQDYVEQTVILEGE